MPPARNRRRQQQLGIQNQTGDDPAPLLLLISSVRQKIFGAPEDAVDTTAKIMANAETIASELRRLPLLL